MTTRVCYVGIQGGELFLEALLNSPSLSRVTLNLTLEAGEQLGEAILQSVRQEKRRMEARPPEADMKSRRMTTQEDACPTEEMATPTESDPPIT